MNLSKKIAILCAVVLISPFSTADIPYDSLEKIRQYTVVTQVLVDSKNSLKSCEAAKNVSELSEKLSLAISNESVVWDNAQILVGDLKLLRERALNCRKRGSCEIYSQFLGKAVKEQASATEVQKLQQEVTALYKKMQPSDYVNALKSLPQPCKILEELQAH